MKFLLLGLAAVYGLRLLREVAAFHRAEARKVAWALGYTVTVFLVALAGTVLSFRSPSGDAPDWVWAALTLSVWLGPELVAKATDTPSPLRELWAHRHDPVTLRSPADAPSDKPVRRCL